MRPVSGAAGEMVLCRVFTKHPKELGLFPSYSQPQTSLVLTSSSLKRRWDVAVSVSGQGERSRFEPRGILERECCRH